MLIRRDQTDVTPRMSALAGLGRMGSLGILDWLSLGASLLGSRTGSAMANGAPGNIVATNVTTNVNASVSPQISPVFVQQQSPENSGVNISASQTGMTPVTGAIPGMDGATFPPIQPGGQMSPGVTLAAVAALGGLFFVMSRKKGKGRRRRR